MVFMHTYKLKRNYYAPTGWLIATYFLLNAYLLESVNIVRKGV